MLFISNLLKTLIPYKQAGKALSISVLNQVISSGTNFGLGLYLVRMLPPAEFGLYGIGIVISLFYAGFGNSLILNQMVIYAPDKKPEDRLSYAGRMLLLVIFFNVITAFLSPFIIFIGVTVWESLAHYAEFSFAVMTASVSYLLKDFFVRHAYIIRKESWALAVNSAIALSLALLLLLQFTLGTSLRVESALWIYSMAHLPGILLAVKFAKLPILKHKKNELIGDFHEAFHGGKWAMLTNLVFFLRTQANTIFVAMLLGPESVAKLNASRLLVTPPLILTPAISQVALPRLATARNQSKRVMRKISNILIFSLLFVAILYYVILLINLDAISALVLSDKYQDLFFVTALWCIWICLLIIRNSMELTAQAAKQFKKSSHINTLGALLSLLIVFIFTFMYGIAGAMFGLILVETIIVIALYRTICKL